MIKLIFEKISYNTNKFSSHFLKTAAFLWIQVFVVKNKLKNFAKKSQEAVFFSCAL